MKERTVMLTVKEKMDRIANIEKLAKDKYGDNYIYGLWGSAQSFLTEENLNIMEKVFGKENN
ncbi:MAG: hypothetical protein FJ256_08000 [Phycisphaerae bacterium]|nr:hypothetical protein [Phycisphaerae bacterium]